MTSAQYETATVALPPITHLLNLPHPSPTNLQPKRTRKHFNDLSLHGSRPQLHHLLQPAANPTCNPNINSGSIPPLQGMDPPQGLCTYSNTSSKPPSSFAPWSKFSTPPITTPQDMPSPPTSSRGRSNSPSPITGKPTLSDVSAAVPPTLPLIPAYFHGHPPPPPSIDNRLPTDGTRPWPPSSTVHPPRCPLTKDQEGPKPRNLAFTTAGDPILKRRRGRPPSKLGDDSCLLEGGWTFLSPTMWSVDQRTAVTSSTSLPSSQSLSDQATSIKNTEPVPHSRNNQTTDATTIQTYLGTNLDSMQIPMRKRGRKPKRIIKGHSCFVWKDIPIVRSPLATAKARATAASNRRAKEEEKQRQQTLWVQKQQQEKDTISDSNSAEEDFIAASSPSSAVSSTESTTAS